MAWTVLFPETLYEDDGVERRIFGADVRVLVRDTRALSELSDADCAEADGLMIMRQRVSEPAAELLPELLRLYAPGNPVWRARLTPHAAFHSLEAWDDIRTKSAETMSAAA